MIAALLIFLIFYLGLWGYIAFGKPVVVYVNSLKFGKIEPQGMTFLFFIVINKNYISRQHLLKHELIHIKQQARYSPLVFLILYLIANKKATGKIFKYSLNNIYEIEAEKAAREKRRYF